MAWAKGCAFAKDRSLLHIDALTSQREYSHDEGCHITDLNPENWPAENDTLPNWCDGRAMRKGAAQARSDAPAGAAGALAAQPAV